MALAAFAAHAARAAAAVRQNDSEALQAIVSGLRSGDARLRSEALESLGKMKLDAKTALPALAGFLADSSRKDPDSVQARAKVTELILGLIPSDHPVASLISALNDPSQNVRVLAGKVLESFAKTGNLDEGIAVLSRAVRNDPSEEAQLLAVSLLGRLAPESPAAVEALLAAREGRVGVRLAAEAALDRSADKIAPALERIFQRDAKNAALWLAKSARGEKFLLDYAVDERSYWPSRFIAAKTLDLASLHARDTEKVEKLLPLFQRGLGMTQHPVGVEIAEEARIAADGLSRMGGAAAANLLLLTQRESPSARIREEAALAMARMDDPRTAALAVPGLVEAAKNGSLNAFKALAKLAPEEAAPLVARISPRDLAEIESPELKAAVQEFLLAELKSEDPARRQEAIRALSHARPFPSAAVGPLTEALSSKDKSIRREAAKALAAAGSQEAVNALTAALKDEDAQVRNYAAVSLAALARNAPNLDYGAVVGALETIVSSRGRSEGNGEVPLHVFQRNAAETLAAIGSKAESALGALRKLAQERGDSNTRAAARRAAEKISEDARKAEEPAPTTTEKEPEARAALAEAALGKPLSALPSKKLGLSDVVRIVGNALGRSPLEEADRVRRWRKSTEEALKQNKNLLWYEPFELAEKDGRKHAGFAFQAKDGTWSFQGEDGFYALMTPDGARESGNLKTGKFIRTDSTGETAYSPSAQSFTHTPPGGQPDIFWDPGGAEGGVSGSFYNYNFHLKPGDSPRLMDGKLYFYRSDGSMKGWMEKDESGQVHRYEVLPNGIGLVRDDAQVMLSPALLPALRAGKIDLSGIPEDKLPRRYREALEKALKAYPGVFSEIDEAFRGNVETFERDGLTYERESSVAGMTLVYDEQDNKYRLRVDLTRSVSAKIDGKGERENSQFFIELQEDGGARVFRSENGSILIHQFNADFDRMTVLVPEEEALKKAGLYRFRAKEEWAQVDGLWEKQSDTGVMEVDMNPSWLRRGVDKAMAGVDKLASPFQSALYGILAGATELSGKAAGLMGFEDYEAMASAQAMFTLGQSKASYLADYNPMPFGPRGAGEYQRNQEMYQAVMRGLNSRQQELVRRDLDVKIRGDQANKKGEAWFMFRSEYLLGQNDPISEARRIEAAGGQFGAANVPKSFLESGQEAWRRGDKTQALWDYLRGGGFILGEGYLEGLGLGFLMSPAKVVAAGGRFGQAAATVEKSVNVERRIKMLSRGETLFFGGNTAAQAAQAGVDSLRAALSGKNDLASFHLNELVQHAAGGLGLLGGLFASSRTRAMGRLGLSEESLRGKAPEQASAMVEQSYQARVEAHQKIGSPRKVLDSLAKDRDVLLRSIAKQAERAPVAKDAEAASDPAAAIRGSAEAEPAGKASPRAQEGEFSAERGDRHVQELKAALSQTLKDPAFVDKIARYARANGEVLARNSPELKRLRNMTSEQLASELQAALENTNVRYATPEDNLPDSYMMGYNEKTNEILINQKFINERPDLFAGALLHELIHQQYPALGEMFAHRVELEHYRYKSKGGDMSEGSDYVNTMENRSNFMRVGDYVGRVLSKYNDGYRGPDDKLAMAKSDLRQKEWLLSVSRERQGLMQSGEWERMSREERKEWINSRVRFRDEGSSAQRNQGDIEAYRRLLKESSFDEVSGKDIAGDYAAASMRALLGRAEADVAKAQRDVAFLRGELLWQRLSAWLPASPLSRDPAPPETPRASPLLIDRAPQSGPGSDRGSARVAPREAPPRADLAHAGIVGSLLSAVGFSMPSIQYLGDGSGGIVLKLQRPGEPAVAVKISRYSSDRSSSPSRWEEFQAEAETGAGAYGKYYGNNPVPGFDLPKPVALELSFLEKSALISAAIKAGLKPEIARRVVGQGMITTEYIPGETLRQYLERGGKLSAEDARTIRAGVQRLDELGYVYTDVKSDNFMVVRGEDGKNRFVLIDAGGMRNPADEIEHRAAVKLQNERLDGMLEQTPSSGGAEPGPIERFAKIGLPSWIGQALNLGPGARARKMEQAKQVLRDQLKPGSDTARKLAVLLRKRSEHLSGLSDDQIIAQASEKLDQLPMRFAETPDEISKLRGNLAVYAKDGKDGAAYVLVNRDLAGYSFEKLAPVLLHEVVHSLHPADRPDLSPGEVTAHHAQDILNRGLGIKDKVSALIKSGKDMVEDLKFAYLYSRPPADDVRFFQKSKSANSNRIKAVYARAQKLKQSGEWGNIEDVRGWIAEQEPRLDSRDVDYLATRLPQMTQQDLADRIALIDKEINARKAQSQAPQYNSSTARDALDQAHKLLIEGGSPETAEKLSRELRKRARDLENAPGIDANRREAMIASVNRAAAALDKNLPIVPKEVRGSPRYARAVNYGLQVVEDADLPRNAPARTTVESGENGQVRAQVALRPEIVEALKDPSHPGHAQAVEALNEELSRVHQGVVDPLRFNADGKVAATMSPMEYMARRSLQALAVRSAAARVSGQQGLEPILEQLRAHIDAGQYQKAFQIALKHGIGKADWEVFSSDYDANVDINRQGLRQRRNAALDGVGLPGRTPLP